MMRLTKASHLKEPTLLDAYKLWTWGVSCCNEGNSKGNNVEYKFDTESHSFDYELGKCGEVRFDWFGDFLNDYVDGVNRAKETFPEVKDRVEAMFDRIKLMKEKIVGFLGPFQGAEKFKAIGLVGVNITALGRGV
jgi:hypothetical protein